MRASATPSFERSEEISALPAMQTSLRSGAIESPRRDPHHQAQFPRRCRPHAAGVALVRRALPAGPLRWLINPEWAPLLEGNPHVDEVVDFPAPEFRGVRGVLRIAPWARQTARTRQAPISSSIFKGLLRSALIAKACAAVRTHACRPVRCPGRCALFLRSTVDVSRHRRMPSIATSRSPRGCRRSASTSADAPLELAAAAGRRRPRASSRGGAVHPPAPLLARRGKITYARTSPRVLPGACAGRKIVIAGPQRGGAAARSTSPSICSTAPRSRTDLADPPRAFVVSVDSGPMHIAAALTPRLLSIHTWSDPRKVGPYQPEAWVWKDGALFQMKHLDEPRPASSRSGLCRRRAARRGTAPRVKRL